MSAFSSSFFCGGADGLTLVPPVGDDEYHRQRPTIRIKPEDAIPLDGYFGLNTSLRPLMRLLDDGRMRIVQVPALKTRRNLTLRRRI